MHWASLKFPFRFVLSEIHCVPCSYRQASPLSVQDFLLRGKQNTAEGKKTQSKPLKSYPEHSGANLKWCSLAKDGTI